MDDLRELTKDEVTEIVCGLAKMRYVRSSDRHSLLLLAQGMASGWKTAREEARLLTETLAAQSAEIARLREGAWQPIETAPKDGRRILVAGGTYSVTSWTYPEELPMGENAREAWFKSGEWCAEDEAYDEYIIFKPTHWQPMPKFNGKADDMLAKIGSAFYRIMERLGAQSDTLAIAGSLGDTLSVDDVLEQAETWLSDYLAPQPGAAAAGGIVAL